MMLGIIKAIPTQTSCHVAYLIIFSDPVIHIAPKYATITTPILFGDNVPFKKGRNDFEDFNSLFKLMSKIYKLTEQDQIEKCLCHCDCYDPNFLIDANKKMYLIDWEYSGNDDPANDLGTFICCSDYTYEEALNIITLYLSHEPSKLELRHYLGYIAIASYYWYVWAIYQESIGNTVGEYLYIWYKNSKFYAKKALELYL